MSARWTFSLQLLGVYLATFHAWRLLEQPGIVAVGLVSTGVLGLLFWRARQRGYFLNFWDGFWHATVILDVLLEGVFVSHHGDHSFYLCAAAFITVVGGYHLWLWRRAVVSPLLLCRPRGELHPIRTFRPSDDDHTLESVIAHGSYPADVARPPKAIAGGHREGRTPRVRSLGNGKCGLVELVPPKGAGKRSSTEPEPNMRR